MKFLLVIHLCSFLTQTCPNMMHPRETFDTWSDCAMAGYQTYAEIFSGIDKNVANGWGYRHNAHRWGGERAADRRLPKIYFLRIAELSLGEMCLRQPPYRRVVKSRSLFRPSKRQAPSRLPESNRVSQLRVFDLRLPCLPAYLAFLPA